MLPLTQATYKISITEEKCKYHPNIVQHFSVRDILCDSRITWRSIVKMPVIFHRYTTHILLSPFQNPKSFLSYIQRCVSLICHLLWHSSIETKVTRNQKPRQFGQTETSPCISHGQQLEDVYKVIKMYQANGYCDQFSSFCFSSKSSMLH